ncbi:hypothetical protein EV1_037230 [Malus domestica]
MEEKLASTHGSHTLIPTWTCKLRTSNSSDGCTHRNHHSQLSSLSVFQKKPNGCEGPRRCCTALPSKLTIKTIDLFLEGCKFSMLRNQAFVFVQTHLTKKAVKLISDGGYGLTEVAGLVEPAKPATEKGRLKSKQVVRTVVLPEACRTMKFVAGLLTTMLIDGWWSS